MPRGATRPLAWVVGVGGIGASFIEAFRDYEIVAIDKIPRDPLPGVKFYEVELASGEAQAELSKIAMIHGWPDAVLFAAGYVSDADLASVDGAELQKIFSNNFSALVFLLQALHAGGRPVSVVVVASNAAFEARPNQPIYAAVKAAIVHLIRSTSVLWAHEGFRIVGIAPGTVIVDRNRESIQRRFPLSPQAPDRPGGRILLPEEIADFARVLVDGADHFTGRTIVMDGGSSLPR